MRCPPKRTIRFVLFTARTRALDALLYCLHETATVREMGQSLGNLVAGFRAGPVKDFMPGKVATNWCQAFRPVRRQSLAFDSNIEVNDKVESPGPTRCRFYGGACRAICPMIKIRADYKYTHHSFLPLSALEA